MLNLKGRPGGQGHREAQGAEGLHWVHDGPAWALLSAHSDPSPDSLAPLTPGCTDTSRLLCCWTISAPPSPALHSSCPLSPLRLSQNWLTVRTPGTWRSRCAGPLRTLACVGHLLCVPVSALGHGGRGQAESEPRSRDGRDEVLELHCVGAWSLGGSETREPMRVVPNTRQNWV